MPDSAHWYPQGDKYPPWMASAKAPTNCDWQYAGVSNLSPLRQDAAIYKVHTQEPCNTVSKDNWQK